MIIHKIYSDGATSGNPGRSEYKVVMATHDCHQSTSLEFLPVIESQVYPLGTNNLMEFLGLVKAIEFFHEDGVPHEFYCDSTTAISWVKKKKYNTSLKRSEVTAELFNHLDHCIEYLNTIDLSKVNIIKWDTKSLGEIPADFGRK